MSSPIESIRHGIQNGSWKKVCDGFALLTGEKHEPPVSSEDEIFRVLRQIAELSHAYLVDPGPKAIKLPAPWEPETEPAFPAKVAAEPQQGRTMDWGDDLAELDGAFDDIGPEPTALPPAETLTPGSIPMIDHLPVIDMEQALPPATVETNAREAAVKSGRVRGLPDFTIEHNQPQGDSEKGRACRALPMDTSPAPNRFVDKRTVAKESIEESKKLSASFAGKEHRPQLKLVTVTCGRCNKTEQVHPDLVPRRLDTQDDKSCYICNKCIGRPNPRY